MKRQKLADRIAATAQRVAENEGSVVRAAEMQQAAQAATDPRVAAARAIGAKPSEIENVREGREGIVIHQRGCPPVVLVDPSKPDAEGKHGLMLLEELRGSFMPVYARRATKAPSTPPAEQDVDPDDEVLASAKAELAEIDRKLAQIDNRQRHPSEATQLSESKDRLTRLVARRPAELAAKREHDRQSFARDRELYTAAFEWAAAVTAASDEEAMAKADAEHKARRPQLFGRYHPGLAQRELDAARAWFAAHELDLPAVEA
jgi:hypothetical protein